MKLKDYVSDRGGIARLARQVNAQPQLMWQWASGVRPVPIERCVSIERATDGAVSRIDLRPDDWHEIWPELVILERNAAHPSTSRPQAAITSEAPQQA